MECDIIDGNTNTTNRVSILIALAVAWIAMLGSLYFSEIAGYIPCKLCWYQRILMYPLAIIILVLLIRRLDREAPYLVLPFSLLGTGIATYHYLLQKTDLFSTNSVCSEGAPCTTTWINWFGFASIPFLALVAFLIITVMMLVILTSSDGDTVEYDDFDEEQATESA